MSMDRRYFLKLLGAAGAVVGTVGIPVIDEVWPGGAHEMLDARLMLGGAVVAQTSVPIVERLAVGRVGWHPVGGSETWDFHAVTERFMFDEVLIRTPKRFADLLPEWSSVWNKLVVVKPGDDVTIQWPPEGFVTVDLT